MRAHEKTRLLFYFPSYLSFHPNFECYIFFSICLDRKRVAYLLVVCLRENALLYENSRIEMKGQRIFALSRLVWWHPKLAWRLYVYIFVQCVHIYKTCWDTSTIAHLYIFCLPVWFVSVVYPSVHFFVERLTFFFHFFTCGPPPRLKSEWKRKNVELSFLSSALNSTCIFLPGAKKEHFTQSSSRFFPFSHFISTHLLSHSPMC